LSFYTEGQKRLVNVSALFVADSQPAELIQPCECPFHYPPLRPEPAAVRGVPLCQQRLDALGTQPCPDLLGTIAAIP
jgi:hypothetical protein